MGGEDDVEPGEVVLLVIVRGGGAVELAIGDDELSKPLSLSIFDEAAEAAATACSRCS